MRRLSLFAALLFVAFSYSPAYAVLFASESFDYPGQGPAIDGLNGGFGWSGGWVDGDVDFERLTSDGISLGFTEYPFPTSGDRLENAIALPAGEAVRNFPNNLGLSLASEGNSLYASALISKLEDGGTGGDNVEFVLAFNGSTQLVRFGISSPDRFFLHNSAAAAQFGDVTFGQSYMLVMKVTAHADTPDLLQGMVYTEGDEIPLLEPTTWDVEHDSFLDSNSLINSVRLVTGANARGAFDEIKLGYSWGAVTNPDYIPGDFDSNGLDMNDYLTLRNNMFTGTTYAQGDINLSGQTDIQDFILFRDAWNAQGLGAFPGTVVPEPSSIALLLFAGVLCGAFARRIRCKSVS